MSSQGNNQNEKGDINQNKEENNNNKPEEAEKDENKKKYKSKFNLLDQGRIMLIGNMEEVSKN